MTKQLDSQNFPKVGSGRRSADPARLLETTRLYDELLPKARIAETIAAKFGVSKRQVYADLQTLEEEAQFDGRAALAARKNQMRSTLQTCFRRCSEEKDWRGAGFFLDRLCKLDGLYAPAEVAVTNTLTVDIGRLSIEERQKRVANLLKAAMPRLKAGTNV